MRRHFPVWPVVRAMLIAVAVIVVLLFALVGVLTLTRGTPVQYVTTLDGKGLPAVSDSLFARTLEMYTGAQLGPGHRVDVLLDGDGTYPQLWADLRGAEHTITAQWYFAQRSAVADTFAAIIRERHRAGVRVRLLLDAFGAQPLKGEWVQSLRDEGIHVAWIRPIKWYTLHRADQRSHVRAIVVDGRTGYTGGFGLADYWQGRGRAKNEWRETNVRFEGPAVAQLQAAFAKGWAEATGELLTGEQFFPPAAFEPAGDVTAALLHTMPTVGSTAAERFLALSIAGARQRLYIANAYFVPDAEFRQLLVRSAQRGVDVRLLTTGPETDIRSTLYAGRRRYEELLEGGVRIWEYQPTNMHAKSFVVDGLFAAIGSLNFDNRSLAFNNESMLVALDPRLGAAMDSIFLDDLTRSSEITLVEFRRRGWTQRLMEIGAHLVSRVL